MILRQMGRAVTGSDRDPLPRDVAARFREAGVRLIDRGAGEGLPPGSGVVVVSAAVRSENPEWREAAARGLAVVKYAQAVAEIAAARRLVAVAGTHGKTTTASLVAWLLDRTGLSRAFLVGGRIEGLGASGAWGDGTHFVLEACEYDRSFLNYAPAVAVVTNVEADHMDYYRTFDSLIEAFAAFVSRTLPGGRVILSADDPVAAILARAAAVPVETTGLAEGADWRATDISLDASGCRFRLRAAEREAGAFYLPLFGAHNVRNAVQALAAAAACGAPLDRLREPLASFPGVERRLQPAGTVNGAPVLNDYGHHPTELAATFAAVRQRYPGRRLVVVFQPHQYSRTAYLFDAFVRVLAEGADDLWLAPVYGARADPGVCAADGGDAGALPSADSATLARAVVAAGRPCRLLPLEEIPAAIAAAARADDVVLVIGAGDIGRVAPEIVRRAGERDPAPDRLSTR